ncbi:MAG: helix-turn-helix domain-containing protein [Chloroflexota bacterium]
MQPTATWPQTLHTARKALRLSRTAVGRLAGVSAETIKAYETGLRQPTRSYLVAILDALKVERRLRNEILVGAGYAPDGDALGPGHVPHYMYSAEAATDHIEGMPWPAFVLNEYAEVVATNSLTDLLWDIDLSREFPDPLDRNMIAVASNPRFADRVENWDETMQQGIAVFKGHHRGPEDIENAGPYFSQVLERFLKGDPKYVGRLMELWQETIPRGPKVRWEYEVHWNEPGIGRMRFLAVVNTASEPDGLAFNDWMPVGAETWKNFEALQKRGRK